MKLNIAKNNATLLLVYFFTFIIVYSILYLVNAIPVYPSYSTLAFCDAGWYKSIVTDGYSFDPETNSNVAFFPLFPYIWKLLGQNVLAVTLFNIILYFFSASFILRELNFTVHQKMFAVLAPSLIFMFIPYSEALFFFSGALIFTGFKKEKVLFVILGIVIAGLSRSAVLMFIPAFLFIAVIKFKKGSYAPIGKVTLYLLTVISCVLAVTYFQYLETDVWFAFNKTRVHWNHVYAIPSFPIRSWNNINLCIDFPAACIGLFCMTEMVLLFLNKIKLLTNRNLEQIRQIDLFSLAYCAGVTTYVLLTQAGDLHSLSRYIFGTVYFWFFLSYFWRNKAHATKVLLLVSVMFLLFTNFFITGGHMTSVKNYFAFLMYQSVIFIPIILLNRPYKKLIIYLSLIILFVLQIHLYQNYLDGKWIG